MSIGVAYLPHFDVQPEDVYAPWNSGLVRCDRDGDVIGKPMTQATGREILTELLSHRGLSDVKERGRGEHDSDPGDDPAGVLDVQS
ncbi:oleate hydratase [Streptomyces yangpuensis]|uniref:oleate hydratase n=1 Tax=Streptomyces yangpuensis TaxID=1648182 RepID=UPI0036B22B1B